MQYSDYKDNIIVKYILIVVMINGDVQKEVSIFNSPIHKIKLKCSDREG